MDGLDGIIEGMGVVVLTAALLSSNQEAGPWRWRSGMLANARRPQRHHPARQGGPEVLRQREKVGGASWSCPAPS